MFPYPSCENCGALYADREAHQRFHDLIAVLYKQAFNLSDEEFERNSGLSAADLLARVIQDDVIR